MSTILIFFFINGNINVEDHSIMYGDFSYYISEQYNFNLVSTKITFLICLSVVT